MEAIAALICVPPGSVSEIWEAVADMIDRAYAEMDDETPDVRTWLVDGKGLLWVATVSGAPVAALTTNVVKTRSGKRVLRMVACGGSDLAAWKAHHLTIEDYARAEGCYKVACEGRPGWKKALPGYEAKRVSLEKFL